MCNWLGSNCAISQKWGSICMLHYTSKTLNVLKIMNILIYKYALQRSHTLDNHMAQALRLFRFQILLVIMPERGLAVVVGMRSRRGSRGSYALNHQSRCSSMAHGLAAVGMPQFRFSWLHLFFLVHCAEACIIALRSTDDPRLSKT